MGIKVGIIGATGMAGSEITKAALAKGLSVTAFVRYELKAKALLGDQVTYVQKDAFDLTKEDLAQVDVLINAFAPANPELADLHIKLAQHLLSLVVDNKPRLGFILGAGSLKQVDGTKLLDSLQKLPGAQSWIAIPESQSKEYDLLKASDVDWFGISPSATFKPGALQEYVLGNDDLLQNDQGISEVTAGTLAKVLIDEVIEPQHRNERFTVVNK